MSKCLCGCGEDAPFSDYVTGHDLKHTYKLIDMVGGREKLENLLSYTGPAKLDLAYYDDKTNELIDRVSPLDELCEVGDIKRNIGDHVCWLVTKVGSPTVDNWAIMPPTLHIPVYGHPI